MVSQRFVAHLVNSASKQLKKVMSGPPEIEYHGSAENLLLREGTLKRISWAVGRGMGTFTPREHLSMRIYVNDPYLEYFDFITEVFNLNGWSYQGVATFSALTPYPIPETFMLRGFVLAPRLYPYELLINQMIKEKQILKQNMIRSAAINAVNADRKLRRKLRGKQSCTVELLGLSRNTLSVSVPDIRSVPGMFSVIPFHGYSLMIAKDAGELDSEKDVPNYNFKARYEALSGVARHIANNPEEGEEPVGILNMDRSIDLSIGPILKVIREEAGVETQEQHRPSRAWERQDEAENEDDDGGYYDEEEYSENY